MPQAAHAIAQHDDASGEKSKEDGGKQSSHVKLEADGKAGDAAIRRMSQGGGEAVGGNDGPAVAKAGVQAGASGMLTAETTAKLDGKDETKLPLGTYVVVKSVKGKELVVKVWSGNGGKEATISDALFKAEPALGHKTDPGMTTEPRDYTYQEYTSLLWDGAPKAGDVAQGRLGDCYLMSAMGAVAAANPKAIMNIFAPHTPNQKSYTVTLHVDDGTGKLKAHPVVVDTSLPTRIQDVQQNAPTYALMGKSMKNHDVPIWPALLEKAYAQMMGGYDVIGDKGGFADAAMEAITGVKRSYEAKPGTPEATLAKFKAFQTAGKAVVCGTLGSKHAAKQGGFAGSGDGPYRASLKTDQGEGAEILEGTLRITDKQGKAKPARDDGKGKLSGGATGSVSYRNGSVDVTWSASGGPGKADDLQAEYDWRGTLDTKLNVHAWHAYIFESVTADGKLQFKNPWGTEHPQAMLPADFMRLFTGINVNEVPKQKPGE